MYKKMELKLKPEEKIAIFLDEEHIIGTFGIELPIEKFVEQNTTVYNVRKHDQTKREITAPTYHLKIIQKWILDNILSKVDISDSVHSFVKNRSILTNVKAHIHSSDSWVLRIDVKNFFNSIKIDEIKSIFIDLGYEIEVADLLSQLCTKDSYLCQGFPTSPTLANIYMTDFDENLYKFLGEINDDFQIVYTRYADDIIISGLKLEGYRKSIKSIKEYVINLLSEKELNINSRKTKVQTKSRKRITGLYIEGNQVKISNQYIKKIKSEIYYCRKYGVSSHLRYQNKADIANFKGYMYGKVGFLKMINFDLGTTLQNELNNLEW